MTQPTALRLADALEMSSNHGIRREAAAELRRLHAELERCKQVCAATSEAWREEAALAEPTPLEDVVTHGSAWSKDGKRIDPMSVYAEPVQEPVAWYFEARHVDSAWAAAVTLKHPGAEGVYMRNVVPLYTAPPQRKPLDDLTIADIYTKWDATPGTSMADFARAIERAHNITGDNT